MTPISMCHTPCSCYRICSTNRQYRNSKKLYRTLNIIFRFSSHLLKNSRGRLNLMTFWCTS